MNKFANSSFHTHFWSKIDDLLPNIDDLKMNIFSNAMQAIQNNATAEILSRNDTTDKLSELQELSDYLKQEIMSDKNLSEIFQEMPQRSRESQFTWISDIQEEQAKLVYRSLIESIKPIIDQAAYDELAAILD